MIFAFPSLRLHFKSEHLQSANTPDINSGSDQVKSFINPRPICLNLHNVYFLLCFRYAVKPSVQCSFITEFDDHIFVTVDADAFFFLHDLITSYVKEKEKVVSFEIPHIYYLSTTTKIRFSHHFP